MDRFKTNYKNAAGNVDKRQKRVDALVNDRKDRRGLNFAVLRNLNDCDETEEQRGNILISNKIAESNENQMLPQTDKSKDRKKLRLQKWKEEKQRQQDLKAKTRSKPPFKAGFVHHDIPPFLTSQPAQPAHLNVSKAPKITAKTQSSSFSSGAFHFTGAQAPKTHSFQPKLKILTATTGSLMTHNKTQISTTQQPPAMKQQQSTVAQPSVRTRNLRSRVVTIANTPNFEKAAAALRTPASSNKRQGRQRIPITPYSNPRSRVQVTTSASYKVDHNPVLVASAKTRRGTVEEVDLTAKENLPRHAETPVLQTPKEKVLITKAQRVTRGAATATAKSDGELQHDCAYFRDMLASTISKLEKQCEYWEQEQEKAGNAVTEVARGQLLLATGMAHLIIREKFAQFRGLIENCEANSEETKTKITDLHGLWDMIYIQVGDIGKKFKELENMKRNNWAPVEQKSAPHPKKKTTMAKPKPAVPTGRSNFRAFLTALKNKDATSDTPSVASSVEKPVTVARRSVVKTPVTSSPVQRRKFDSPKASAIWSASRIAKSAGRKSFTADEARMPSPTANSSRKTEQSIGTPTRFSIRRRNTATPLQGILKSAQPTPQSVLSKKAVNFSVPVQEEKEEDDVLSTPIPIVKHTYSHHQTTPMNTDKDKVFEELFFSAHSTPPSLSDDEHIGLNESYTIEEAPSKFAKPPTPYVKRKVRTSARFSPYDKEETNTEMDIQMNTPSEGEIATSSVSISPVKTQLSKLSVSENRKVSLLYTPPDNTDMEKKVNPGSNDAVNVVPLSLARKGRRSSRIPVPILNDVANLPNTPELILGAAQGGRRSSRGRKSFNTPDLISWDSPERNGNPRRSTRARKSSAMTH